MFNAVQASGSQAAFAVNLPDGARAGLSACVLIEAHDEWQVTDRRYLSEASMAQLTPPAPTTLPAIDSPTPTQEVHATTVAKTA